jgi:phosphoribosylformylglycinamidine cyclo-ligase
MRRNEELTYAGAGVSIDAGDETVALMRAAVKETHGPDVLAELGTFGAMFRIPGTDLVSVSSIDGVGTRIKVGVWTGNHASNGASLVNHCINDLLVMGCPARYFLDYFGTSKLEPDVAAKTIIGAAEACKEQSVALIGGETAEMPGFYGEGLYDLVGSITGFVHEDRLVTGQDIRHGDQIIGVGSNGLHTNGYSHAIKTIFELEGLNVDSELPWGITVGDELTKSHRCYSNAVLPLMQTETGVSLISGAAHITGGGLPGNLIRPLPEECRAMIYPNSWNVPEIFTWIKDKANQPLNDWRRTYNLGIGLVLVVRLDHVNFVLRKLMDAGETVSIIGEVRRGERDVEFLN